MSKFTKGPWKVTPHLDVMKGHNYIAPISIMTKKYMTVNEETRANARLIAAAPDMYQHLRLILNGEFSSDDVEQLLARIDGEEEKHE